MAPKVKTFEKGRKIGHLFILSPHRNDSGIWGQMCRCEKCNEVVFRSNSYLTEAGLKRRNMITCGKKECRSPRVPPHCSVSL